MCMLYNVRGRVLMHSTDIRLHVSIYMYIYPSVHGIIISIYPALLRHTLHDNDDNCQIELCKRLIIRVVCII
jgi:hypothetical protein